MQIFSMNEMFYQSKLHCIVQGMRHWLNLLEKLNFSDGTNSKLVIFLIERNSTNEMKKKKMEKNLFVPKRFWICWMNDFQYWNQCESLSHIVSHSVSVFKEFHPLNIKSTWFSALNNLSHDFPYQSVWLGIYCILFKS